MRNPMALLKTEAIQWHEGMLILPQHFQQSDLRLRELMYYHLTNVSSFHWGVSKIEIDPVLFANGIISVLLLEAIMPDGLVIINHNREGEQISLDLKGYETEFERGSISIYLSIPAYRAGAANFGGDLPRFHSRSGDLVVDENTGKGETMIPRVTPNATLTAGKPPSNYISIPLFKISKDSNMYALESYIPPTLKVTNDSRIGQMCNQICQRLREKISYLAERIQANANHAMTNETEQTARALSSGLLPFEARLKSEGSHPYELYISLCVLASQIAGLHPSQVPPIFEKYDHDDLESTYNSVVVYINAMIDRVRTGYTINLFSLADRTFSLELKSNIVIGNELVIGVKAPSSMEMADLSEWALQSVIATDSFVTHAMDSRVLGASRRIIPGDEAMSLAPAKGVVLLSVQIDPSYIKIGETLRIFNVSDQTEKRPIEVALYTPKASA